MSSRLVLGGILVALPALGCGSSGLLGDNDGGTPEAPEPTPCDTLAGTPGDTAVVTVAGAPLDHSVVPRDLATNTAVVELAGALLSPGFDALRLDVHRDGELRESISVPACDVDGAVPFSLSTTLDAELAVYDLELFAVAGGESVSALLVEDVVVGDILLMQGQSNAVARQFSGNANVNRSEFVRSYGSRVEDGGATSAVRRWYLAEGNYAEGPGAVGQWGLRMGRRLVDATGIPLGIINGARGGRPIGYFARNDADPGDLSTNYGRLLSRARWAGVDAAARAVLYYQGEADGNEVLQHVRGFTGVVAAWREDFGGLERVYTTQVRNGCGSPNLALRDGQRRLADDLEDLSVMSTTGLDGHDGCHYSYANGYEALGDRYAAMLLRDLFGGGDLPGIDPPNPATATLTGPAELTLETRGSDPLTVVGDPSGDFRVDGADVDVVSVAADGAGLRLTLSGEPAGATGVSYVGRPGGGAWVGNEAGVGMLTFTGIPIAIP